LAIVGNEGEEKLVGLFVSLLHLKRSMLQMSSWSGSSRLTMARPMSPKLGRFPAVLVYETILELQR